MTEPSQACVDTTSPNLARTSRRSSQDCTFVSEFGYLAVFSNAGYSKLSDVENDAKFCTFEISVPTVEALPNLELHLMAILYTAAENRGLITKKKVRKKVHG